ncbi:MAG: hypothetical protein CSB55_01160 [Candidatus Cloacimonadota bacterium]|nr:MAG: hypothetical protein CSB55_01160 [Candidatus Cloacimonadota bacterium]
MKNSYKLILICFLLFLFVGCIKKLETPEWDVNLEIPLINKNYYVYDLQDSVNIVSEDGIMYYQNTGDITSLEVSSDILTISENSEKMNLISTDIVKRGGLPLDNENEENEIELRYAVTSEWYLHFAFNNLEHPEYIESISFTFENVFETSDSEPFTKVFNGNFGTETIEDLSNFIIKDDTLGPQEVLDSLRFTVEIKANDGASLDDFDLTLSYEKMKFSYVEGKVFNKRLDIEDNSTEIDIEYPVGIENTLNQHGAKLIFDIDNPIGFDCTFYGKISAYNMTSGITNYAIIDETDKVILEHAENGEVKSTTVILQGEKIDALLNTYPEKVTLDESYLIIGNKNEQGEVVTGYIREGVKVSGTHKSKVPFEMILINNSELEDDTQVADSNYIQPSEIQEIDISSDNQEIIEERANHAEFILNLENSVPGGAIAHLYFADNEEDVFENPVLKIPREDEDTSFEPALSDNQTGETSPVVSEIRLKLSHEDLMIFLTDKLYLGTRFVFKDSGGEPVKIKSEDYIGVTGYIELSAHISEK